MVMSDTNGRCMYQYTVKRGDSFYLIAHRLGVGLRELLEANPDIPPSRLTVGDVLCIPGADVEKPACENPDDAPGGETGPTEQSPGQEEQPENSGYACPANRRTVVQEGQTASDLQLRYNLSYHTLKAANSDRDLEQLQGGDVICVPESNIACPLPASIVLGENDTLESVAMRYNVPIAELLRVNPCLAPRDFTAGATVRLPE
ncbi:MAG: LysM peptidoglycan-binding domain-containing protein [Clostridia bacterium]|nr:LysM peptidoglycan-binding domain-containing protein [Clostridia bacterium]